MNSIRSMLDLNVHRTGQAIAFLLGVGAITLGSLGAIAPLANAHTQATSSLRIAQSPTPLTYITEVSEDELEIEITEGEFYFHGYLERTSGNMYVGHDAQVRVMYDRDTSRVVVINLLTGDEYYNYFFSITDEGAL